MNDIKKILLLATVGVCLVLALFTLYNNRYEEDFLPQTISIENKTNYPTLIYNTKYILHNYMGVDTVEIKFNNPETIFPNVESYTLKNIFINKHYIIFLTKSLSNEELKRELCIQMVYIKKYETGELKVVDFSENLFEYKGQLYDATNVFITNRPYDIEIKREGKRLYNRIKNDLL